MLEWIRVHSGDLERAMRGDPRRGRGRGHRLRTSRTSERGRRDHGGTCAPEEFAPFHRRGIAVADARLLVGSDELPTQLHVLPVELIRARAAAQPHLADFRKLLIERHAPLLEPRTQSVDTLHGVRLARL